MLSAACYRFVLKHGTWRRACNTPSIHSIAGVKKIAVCAAITDVRREHCAILDLFGISFETVGIFVASEMNLNKHILKTLS